MQIAYREECTDKACCSLTRLVKDKIKAVLFWKIYTLMWLERIWESASANQHQVSVRNRMLGFQQYHTMGY